MLLAPYLGYRLCTLALSVGWEHRLESAHQHHLVVLHSYWCVAVNFLAWVAACENWPKEKVEKVVGTWGNCTGELGEMEGCPG